LNPENLMNKISIISAACGICLFALPTHADPAPFVATAIVTDGANLPLVTEFGSNFINFANSIIDGTGQFQTLARHPYSAVSTFLGVPHAIIFSTNGPGTSVTLTLTPIGFTKTFTGVSSGDVNSQVDAFFEKNGQGIFASFLKAIAEKSPIAVTDGNPLAAPAIEAQGIFQSTAVTPDDTLVDQASGQKPKFGGFAIGFDAGSFKSGGFKGDDYDLSLTALSIALSDKVRLQIPVTVNYLTVDGAKVYGAGFDFALPIALRVMDTTNPWNWRVTPLAGISGRGSTDLASGVGLWDVGLVSTVDYKVNSKLILCLMDQITSDKSFSVTYGSYGFNPDVDQQIMKNGVRLVTPLGDDLVLDVFVVESNFLKTAVTKQFTTFGTSLALRATPKYRLCLAANVDTGSSFSSWSLGINSAWRW
jgi:hypothetical protein